MKCYDEPLCNWYSFGENLCMLFQTCTEIDETKSNFTTQLYKCPQSKFTERLVKAKDYTKLSFPVQFDKQNYSIRYPDHFIGEDWESYIERKVDHIDKDCGLDCEESATCDFFVLGEKERDVDVCFFGTFRKRAKGLKYGSTSKYRIEIYPVFKGTQSMYVVQY